MNGCADCAADPEGICPEHDAQAEAEYQATMAVSPMEDIPWGTPDEWIPDNPNEDGLTMRDFL